MTKEIDNVKQEFQVPTNFEQWFKSYQNNPDSSTFYTTQINSTQELLDRCKKLTGNQC